MNNLQKQVVNICEKLFSLVVKATVYSKIRYQSTPLDWQNYFKYLSSIYLSIYYIYHLSIYLSLIYLLSSTHPFFWQFLMLMNMEMKREMYSHRLLLEIRIVTSFLESHLAMTIKTSDLASLPWILFHS